MARALILLGGLAGAAGVALSAAAAHQGGQNLGTAASFLLMHAPALLVLGLLGRSRLALAGGLVLAVGLALFAGDLLARTYLGSRLFPFAAPAGGMLLIGGWLVVATSALFARRH